MTGIELALGAWVLVTAVGALLGLDGISWPQSMASRPIVAGTLGGAIFGAPGEGFLVGAWLELIKSRHPPYGAARYPETGPAALVAGAAFALADSGSVTALVAAVLAGWTLGWVGSHSIAALRVWNTRLVGDPTVFGGRPEEVERRHRTAIRLDAARAALLTGALFVPAVLGVRLFDSLSTPGGAPRAALLAGLSLVSLGGVGARLIGGGRSSWWPFVAGGLAAGLLSWGVG